MLFTHFALAFLVQQPAELPDHVINQIDPGRDVVRLNGKNLALLKPIHVAGNVQRFEWMTDNTLFAQEVGIGDKALQSVVHQYKSGKRVATKLGPNETIDQIAGVGEGKFYVSTQLPGNDANQESLWFGDGSKLTKLYSDVRRVGFVVAGKDMMYQHDIKPNQATSFFWVRDGKPKKQFDFPAFAGYRYLYPDPQQIIMVVRGTANRELAHFGFNPFTGEFEKLDRQPDDPRTKPPLQTHQFPIQIPSITESVRSALLIGEEKSDFPTALIATDCDTAIASPDKKNVAYISQGHAFVRPIIEVTDDQLEGLLERKESIRLLSQVKQVGTGWAIYAADNDDVLPGSAEKTSEMIMPYLKSEKLLSGFAYVFGGGATSKVAEPTKTVLGYVQGRYGRAVVYLDTHARWESNRKKKG
ncbi:MAG: hypothetical protein ABL962_12065 [Fimbriimonadaceae bacterium]